MLDPENPDQVQQITGVEDWNGTRPGAPVMWNQTGLPGTCSETLEGVCTVRIEWTGETEPPPTIKLYVNGQASAYATPTVQAISAANGLGDAMVTQTFPNGNQVAYSFGSWFREISIPNGLREIEFPVSASATSFGVNNTAAAGLLLTASKTGWALAIGSNRDVTFGRAVDPQTGMSYQRPNGLGTDGSYYADTSADVYDTLGWIVAVLPEITISGTLIGPWSPSSIIEWTLQDLNGDLFPPLETQRIVSHENYLPTEARPLGTGIATMAVSDATNSLYDSVSYILRVHFPAEKVDVEWAWSGWLHNCPEPDEELRLSYVPLKLHTPLVNLTTNPVTRTYIYQFSTTWSIGWKYTVEQGGGLSAPVASVEFGSTVELNSEVQWSTTSEIKHEVTISPGQRFIHWVVTYGTAENWTTSRWGINGFLGDTTEVTTRDGHLEEVLQTTPATQPITFPI